MPNLVERRCGYCDGNKKLNVGDSLMRDIQNCPVCEGYGKVRVPSTIKNVQDAMGGEKEMQEIY